MEETDGQGPVLKLNIRKLYSTKFVTRKTNRLHDSPSSKRRVGSEHDNIGQSEHGRTQIAAVASGLPFYRVFHRARAYLRTNVHCTRSRVMRMYENADVRPCYMPCQPYQLRASHPMIPAITPVVTATVTSFVDVSGWDTGSWSVPS